MRSIFIAMICLGLTAQAVWGNRRVHSRNMNAHALTSDDAIDESNYGNFPGTFTGMQLQFSYSSADPGTVITGVGVYLNSPTPAGSPSLCTLAAPYAVPPGGGTITTPMCFFSRPL